MTPQQLTSVHGALQQKDYTTAERLLQAALAASPNDPDAHHWLGVLASLKKLPRDAIVHWKRALELAPEHSAARHNLIQLLMGEGQAEQALQHLPHPEMLADAGEFLLAGQVLLANRQWRPAVDVLYRFIALVPDHIPGLAMLSQALEATGQLETATLPLHHALLLQPKNTELHLSLARLLTNLRADGPAEQHYQQALASDPNSVAALIGQGKFHYQKHRLLQALACAERALTLKCDVATRTIALNLGGMIHMALGEPEAGIDMLREAVAALPRNMDEGRHIRSNYMFSLLFADDATSGATLLQEARNNTATLPAPVKRSFNSKLAGRKLRIGYVSPDFRLHAVTHFLLPLIANHNFSVVEVFCYADMEMPDAMTRAYQALPVQWRAVARLSHPELEALILKDAVDVLIDLAGHTADNRLPVFARRAALVQASWIGYPGTTGLDSMDYFISDAIASPPEVAANFSEQLLRLDGPLFCYRPPVGGEALPVAEAPVLKNGYITFGAYNNLAKANLQLLGVWAKLLDTVPNSRLRIKGKAFADAAARERFIQRCSSAGLDPARLDLAPYHTNPVAHLADYANIDIHLDAHPFGGGVTTCDALWMGVPLVTHYGERHTTRVPLSVLTHLGHPEWAAGDAEGYIRIAAELAADPQRLAAQRRTLRDEMQRSPLRDEKAFARSFEQALRKAWQSKSSG